MPFVNWKDSTAKRGRCWHSDYHQDGHSAIRHCGVKGTCTFVWQRYSMVSNWNATLSQFGTMGLKGIKTLTLHNYLTQGDLDTFWTNLSPVTRCWRTSKLTPWFKQKWQRLNFQSTNLDHNILPNYLKSCLNCLKYWQYVRLPLMMLKALNGWTGAV